MKAKYILGFDIGAIHARVRHNEPQFVDGDQHANDKDESS